MCGCMCVYAMCMCRGAVISVLMSADVRLFVCMHVCDVLVYVARSLILFNCILRVIWFGVPDSLYGASYRPQNTAMDGNGMTCNMYIDRCVHGRVH